MQLEPAWERELPFCPTSIRALGDGFQLSDGARSVRMDASGAGAVSEGPPGPDAPGEGGDAERAAAERIALRQDREVPTGVILWENRALFVDATAGVALASRAGDGKPLWSVRVAGAIVAPAQFHRARLLLQSLDNYVYCLRAENGHEVWRSRLSHRLIHPAAFWHDRVLAVPEGSSTLVLLDLWNGSENGSWTLRGPDAHFVTGPAVVGDRVAAAHSLWGSSACRLTAMDLTEPG